MEAIFYDKVEEYDNKLDPLSDYHEELSHAVMLEEGITLGEARELVAEIIREEIKDPEIMFFMRQENGDRVVRQTTLLNYIKVHNHNRSVIAPTFTTYIPPDVVRSVLADYIFHNVKRRAAVKKEAQAAYAEGRMDEARSLDGQQKNLKGNNNGLSGLFAMVSSVVYNITNHSTLTTLTRSITSLSNANNERLIEGNRSLYTPRDVLRAVVYETTYCDQEAVRAAMQEFGLHYPTVSEVVKVLTYSSDLYTRDYAYYERYVIPHLEKCTPEQLAFVVYALDLKHTMEYNPEFFKQFMDSFTFKVTHHTQPLDNYEKMYEIPEAIMMFVHTIFSHDLEGKGKKYKEMNQGGLLSNMYETGQNIINHLYKYQKFFNAFIKVNISPTNSYKLKDMRRRAVVLSDTDSSAFSTDLYVKWRLGKFEYTERSTAISGMITYFASESIVHQLTMLSKTMNIPLEQLRTLAMKNEFLWAGHVPTDVSKHYYANACIEEGNVHAKAKLENKGVHLRNSTVPVESIEEGYRIMNYILDSIKYNKPLSLDSTIQDVIRIENAIITSINKGETTYLKFGRINDPTSYKKGPTESPYARHLMWEEVFKPKYGNVPNPPYMTVKLPMVMTNKTKLKKWVEDIEDKEFAGRLDKWLTKNNKSSLPNLYLNSEWIASNGFGKELQSSIDTQAVVLDMTKQLRLILESLGLLLVDGVPVREQFVYEFEKEETKH